MRSICLRLSSKGLMCYRTDICLIIRKQATSLGLLAKVKWEGTSIPSSTITRMVKREKGKKCVKLQNLPHQPRVPRHWFSSLLAIYLTLSIDQYLLFIANDLLLVVVTCLRLSSKGYMCYRTNTCLIVRKQATSLGLLAKIKWGGESIHQTGGILQ